MDNQSNDPQWKELADQLRKLNLDYYWRLRNRINGEVTREFRPPSRLDRTSGMGISLSMRQEHTPPGTCGDRGTDNTVKPSNPLRRTDPSKGGHR